MKRTPKYLFLLLAAMLAAAGCDEENGGDGDTTTGGDATDVAGDGETTGGTDTDVIDSDVPCVTEENPGGDADGDGIENFKEDKNLDCVVDADETDWNDADTDGDGIPDGEEDINRNGIVDNGEDDPKLSDSDGDGVPDNQESKRVICTPDLLDSVSLTVNTQATDTVIALPNDFSSARIDGQDAATFSNDASDVFGYIVKRDSTGSGIAADNGSVLLDISNCDTCESSFVQQTTRPFQTWYYEGDPSLPARDAVQSVLQFSYGPDASNAGSTEKDPAALRDEIITALTGAEYTSEEGGTACASITTYNVTILRGDGSVIVAGIMTCSDNLDGVDANGDPVRAEEERAFLFTDFYGASVIAPLNFQPNDFRCKEFDAGTEGGQVDFLWVIDNSVSMRDEQQNVAATADTFLNSLATSDVDWRLGVTTTEAFQLSDTSGEIGIIGAGDGSYRNYLIDAGLNYPGGKDDKMNLDYGLRSVDTDNDDILDTGFLSKDDPIDDTRQRFIDFVTEDIGCEEGINQNTCGWFDERGLESALYVLDKLATAPETEPTYRLRPDALTVIIFISDEEDFDFKPGNTPLAPDSTERNTLTESFVQRFGQYDAIATAIVGDVGTDGGGSCEPLDEDTGTGAEYGLGYLDITNATGGVSGTICSDNLQVTIDAIIRLGIVGASRYQLEPETTNDGYPIAPTIRVALDGVELDRSLIDGWDYDAATNAIVFYGQTITGASNIAVGYKRWVPSDN